MTPNERPWIPCSERLPEPGFTKEVQANEGETLAWYSSTGYWWPDLPGGVATFPIQPAPTHWRELE